MIDWKYSVVVYACFLLIGYFVVYQQSKQN